MIFLGEAGGQRERERRGGWGKKKQKPRAPCVSDPKERQRERERRAVTARRLSWQAARPLHPRRRGGQKQYKEQ